MGFHIRDFSFTRTIAMRSIVSTIAIFSVGLIVTAVGIRIHDEFTHADSPGITMTPNIVHSGGGDRVTIDVDLSISTTWEQFSMGSGSSCAIDTNHDIYCWGSGRYMELQDEETDFLGLYSYVPRKVNISGKYTQVQRASSGICALREDGVVNCWGYADSYFLGNGASGRYWLTEATPSTVALPNTAIYLGAGPYSDSGGNANICAIITGGDVYCWGGNRDGILGNGNTSSQLIPVKTNTAQKFKTVATGGSNSCGITTSDDIYCWGSGYNGALGQGSTSNSTSPVKTNTSVKFQSLSVGSGGTTCALSTSGTVYCWGGNTYGQIGDGTTSYKTSPVAINSGTVYTSVATSGYTTCATTAASVDCWGAQDFLNGNNQSSPTQIYSGTVSTTHIQMVNAGYNYRTQGCYFSSGQILCFGRNSLDEGRGIGLIGQRPDPLLSNDYEEFYYTGDITSVPTPLSAPAHTPSVLPSEACTDIVVMSPSSFSCKTTGGEDGSSGMLTVTVDGTPYDVSYSYANMYWQDVADCGWYYEHGLQRYNSYGRHQPGESAEYPYIITTAPELACLSTVGEVGELAGKTIKLVPDGSSIDLSGMLWLPSALYGDFDTEERVTIIGAPIENLNIYASLDCEATLSEWDWYAAGYGMFSEIAYVDLIDFELESPTVYLDAVAYMSMPSSFGPGGMPIAAGSVAGTAMYSNIYARVNNPSIDVTNIRTTNYDGFAFAGGIVGVAVEGVIINDSSVVGGSIEVMTSTAMPSWSPSTRAGGIVGYANQSVIVNSYSATTINSSGSAGAFGGIVGSLTLDLQDAQWCLVNNYSRTEINISSHQHDADSNPGLIAGLVGYLSDNAVNNYYKGDISIDDDLDGWFAAYGLFSSIEEPWSEPIEVFGNWYDPSDGLDPIGNSSLSGQANPEYETITTAAQLLVDLESGRTDAIATLSAHHGFTGRSAEARIAHWMIDPSQNDGWPIFGDVPYIESITPNTGPDIGGSKIRIKGRYFTASTTIEIDGTPCQNLTVLSSQSLYCYTPPHALGVVDVTVTTENGADTFTGGFTYTDTLAAVDATPTTGTIDGGTSVMIYGAYFGAAPAVEGSVIFGNKPSIDDAPCAVTSWSDTAIACTTSSHDRGVVDVKISDGVTTYVLAQSYSYVPSAFGSFIETSFGGDVVIDITPSSSGTISTGSHDIHVRTDYEGGYLLAVEAYDYSNTLDHITGLGQFQPTATTGPLAPNTWGVTLLFTSFSRVPIGTPLVLKSTDQASYDGLGDPTTVRYGVNADYSVPAGSYRGSVVYTVLPNN